MKNLIILTNIDVERFEKQLFPNILLILSNHGLHLEDCYIAVENEPTGFKNVLQYKTFNDLGILNVDGSTEIVVSSNNCLSDFTNILVLNSSQGIDFLLKKVPKSSIKTVNCEENTESIEQVLVNNPYDNIWRICISVDLIKSINPEYITVDNAWEVLCQSVQMFKYNTECGTYLYKHDVLCMKPEDCSGKEIIDKVLDCLVTKAI